MAAQVSAPNPDFAHYTPQVDPPYQRPGSPGRIIPNSACARSKIWLFPAKLHKKINWVPVVAILGTIAALIALDPHATRHFRRISTFSGPNNVFTGNATAIGTAIVPAGLYVSGLISNDAKVQCTALLPGEVVADTGSLASRPFSKVCTGFVLGDGSVVLHPLSGE
jgi:hypothetical protein